MAATLKRKRQSLPVTPNKLLLKKVEEKAADAVVDDANEDSESHNDEDAESEVDDRDAYEARKSSSQLPSASELRAINEAANLFKSNTFKYQLEALLASVRPKVSHIPPLERTLQKLYTHLTSLPAVPPVHPLEAAETLQIFSLSTQKKKVRASTPKPSTIPVTIPYPAPALPQSTAWKVAFEPPTAMNVVGSWSDDLAVRKPDRAPFGVDVVVEMPGTLFQEKDYRNSRFFHKRAFYIACLAASLAQPSSPFNANIMYEGDSRRTTLLLTPREDGSEHDFHKLHAAIRIIPVLADDAPIPIHRLAPAQSNIRTASVSNTHPNTEAPQPPTPHYNSTLALSLARTARTRLLGAHGIVGAAPSFRDALALLRVWANQRGFGAGAGSPPDAQSAASTSGTGLARNYCIRGFSGLGAWWACILEVLVFGEEPVGDTGKAKNRYKRPLVGKGLSSYQLFRAALDFLAKHNFEKEGVFMKVVERGQKFDQEEWTAHHEAVFVDATGTVNMLSGVPASSLELLRHDAQSTLHLLNTGEDPFSAVFLTDMREPHARFDAVIRITLLRLRPTMNLDFPSTQAATLHALSATVRKALNTRAHAVVPLQARTPPRPLSAAHAAPLTTLSLGVIFDAAHATRLVDHGPPAGAPEADVQAFRAFWGSKAELRRFKDGRIVESCVWDNVEDREAIPARIVRHVLQHHFGLGEEDVCVLAGDYGRVMAAPTVRGRGGASYRDALAAFDKLVKELKALEDEGAMPLMLVAAKPCAPALRHTSVFPPSPVASGASPHPSAAHLPAFEVALQLERSAQWPDDLRAIQKVKLALLESMARGLVRRSGGKCRACVVLDQGASDVEDGCALEVVLDGWAFHARIGHDREVTLLQDVTRELKRPGRPVVPAHERQAATRALQTYRRRFVHAPAHHSAILALHHKFPAFAYTTRLVQRWLGAHWLSARVAPEAAELLCARVFLLHAEDVPACGKRGFVRVVEFLRTWDGAAYVPLYEAVREGEGAVGGEKRGVEAGRGGWRLMTAEDEAGTVWCEDVTVAVAARVREVAKATVRCLEAGTSTFGPLFEHPTTDYDFLIELDPRAVSRYWQGLHAAPSVWNPSGYANLADGGEDGEAVRVAFNPAELYFRDLQTVYGDTMELFYDVHGGTTIGGVWNPSVAGTERHAWRVFLGFSSLPVASGAQQKKEKPSVTFNAEGVLVEIERMGEGLVTKITVRE